MPYCRVCQRTSSKSKADRSLDAVLFLDVDGVLHPHCSNSVICSGQMESPLFLPTCMSLLQEIIRETGACIVLSTAWRIHDETRNRLMAKLLEWKLPVWIGVTRQLPGQQRPREILEWVDKHQPTTWVAVDDWPLHQAHRMHGHFVQTRSRTGLEHDTATRIKQLFAKQKQHQRDLSLRQAVAATGCSDGNKEGGWWSLEGIMRRRHDGQRSQSEIKDMRWIGTDAETRCLPLAASYLPQATY